jgi:hypothetical protein
LIEDEYPYGYLGGIVLKPKLGKRGPQRVADGGDRRQQRRLSRGSRHLVRLAEGALEAIEETFTNLRISTNNPLERILREIRRCT